MRSGTLKPKREEVRHRRDARGWSQQDLADRAGCKLRTITNAEAGKPVYANTLANIAVALECEVEDLLDRGADGPTVSATAQPLGNAPPLPTLLIGRDADLAMLSEKLCSATSWKDRLPTQIVTAVRGWPGVGKTTLARAVAHHHAVVEGFPDGVLWTSLGPSPVIIAELNAWGRVLHDPELACLESPAAASSRLAGVLRERRMLLIIDDAWEASHVTPFAVGGRNCAMLVTTRLSRLADELAPTPADIVRLDVLPEAEALKLLDTLAPSIVATHPAECRDLVQLVEGLPLALQVAGRMLRSEQAHGWSVTELLTELREDVAKILSAQAPVDMAAVPGDVSPTVAALLRKSTDHLDPIVRKRFAYLAPFAPRPATFELSDMAYVWKTDEDSARATANILVDRGLLEPIGEGFYQIHQVLVGHARTLLPKR